MTGGTGAGGFRSVPEALSSRDRGFLLGDALFETVRVYGGRTHLLPEHLERLRRGARTVGIPIPEELPDTVDQAVREWEGNDGALRITLSRGMGSGLLPDPASPPTLVVQLHSWAPDPEWYTRGLTAVLAGRVDEEALTAGLKKVGYLEHIQALREARERGADEAILRNTRGLLAEGSASNLFVVTGGRVAAPGRSSGALAGVTRGVLLGLLREEGVPVREEGVSLEEAAVADEIFLSSSLRELVPVVRLEGGVVGSGRPGPLFRHLLERYRAGVGG